MFFLLSYYYKGTDVTFGHSSSLNERCWDVRFAHSDSSTALEQTNVQHSTQGQPESFKYVQGQPFFKFPQRTEPGNWESHWELWHELQTPSKTEVTLRPVGRRSPPSTCNQAPPFGNVWDGEGRKRRSPSRCMDTLPVLWSLEHRLLRSFLARPRRGRDATGRRLARPEPRPAPAHPARGPPRPPPPTSPRPASRAGPRASRSGPGLLQCRAPLHLGARSKRCARRGRGRGRSCRLFRISGAVGLGGEGGRLEKGRGDWNPEHDLPNWAPGTGIPASPSGRAAEGGAGAGGGGVRGGASAPGGPGNTGKSRPHGFARPGLHLAWAQSCLQGKVANGSFTWERREICKTLTGPLRPWVPPEMTSKKS